MKVHTLRNQTKEESSCQSNLCSKSYDFYMLINELRKIQTMIYIDISFRQTALTEFMVY